MNKRVVLAGIAGVVLLVVFAVIAISQGGGDDSATDAPAASGDVIRGSFRLIDAGVTGQTESCTGGTGGFSDFGAGMNVTVTNGDGEIIGTSSTRNAPIEEITEYLVAADPIEGQAIADIVAESTVSCVVLFDVEVDDSEFYGIEVGSRGDLSFSAEDLAATDFTVALTLGT